MSSITKVAEMETDEKTQKEINHEMNSISSSPNKDESSEKISFSAANSDKKSPTLHSFSKLLEGVVMAANSAVSSDPSSQIVGFQGRCGMSHQEALAIVTANAAQAHPQMQLQAESPPIAQSDSSLPISSAVAQKEHLQSLQDKDNVEGNDKKTSSSSSIAALPSPEENVNYHNSNEPAEDVRKIPKSDGYSWRKYGQKQVKSSGSSRSYYRCSHFSCHARKKVQHLDVSGQIIDVVYRGNHNHDPPQHTHKGSNRKKVVSDSSVRKLDDPGPPTRGSELEQVVQLTRECEDGNVSNAAGTSHGKVEGQHSRTPDTTLRCESEPATLSAEAVHDKSYNSNELDMTDAMKDRDVVPLKKRRIKESGKACSSSVYRTFKEPKIVVQAAAEVGPSTDGYRWRKYGQKMVKGNLHPRSYYRCSSAGCPVRKHVERATDDSAAIIATYEGQHNHDMPVPKKHHGSPKSSVDAVSTGTADTAPVLKSEPLSPAPGQGSPAQQSRNLDSDLNGEKATPEAGADKVLESARTLLSIGIELKSC